MYDDNKNNNNLKIKELLKSAREAYLKYSEKYDIINEIEAKNYLTESKN